MIKVELNAYFVTFYMSFQLSRENPVMLVSKNVMSEDALKQLFIIRLVFKSINAIDTVSPWVTTES